MQWSAQLVVSRHAPDAHDIGAAPVHTPEALHIGAGVSVPALHEGAPHATPTRGDQSLPLRAGSHVWQGLPGFVVPAPKHVPAMMQMLDTAECMHACVASTHVSIVQVDPSSHAVPVPPTQ